MFLYRRKDDDNVEIYELIPREEEIKKFKRLELAAIPSKRRFMQHTTMKDLLYSDDGILYVAPFNKLNTRKIIGIGCNDMFEYQSENEKTKEIQQRFINNDYDGLEANKLYKLIGGTREKNRLYFLVTEYYETPYKKSTLHNIMVLPRQLFIVRALETGRLDLIEGERLTEEMELFDIEHIKDVNFNATKELTKVGLLDERIYSKSYKEAEELIDCSEKILKFKLK